jgi:hypothetical protein
VSEDAAMAGDHAPDPAPAECTKVDIVARLGGCGVLRKLGGADESGGNEPSPSKTRARTDGEPLAPMIERWHAIGGDHGLAYRFLREHRHALLNLITVDEFLAGDPADRCRAGAGMRTRAVGA